MERYGCACQDHQTNLKCEGRSVSLKGNGLTFFQLEIQNSMTLASDLYNNSIHNIYIYIYIYIYPSFWHILVWAHIFELLTAAPWCQGTAGMLSFNHRFLGISLGAFSAWRSSRSSDSIRGRSSQGPTVGGKSF